MLLGSKLAMPQGVIISHRLTIGKCKIGSQVSDRCPLGYLFSYHIQQNVHKNRKSPSLINTVLLFLLKINPPVTMSGWMISFLIVVTEVYVIMVRLIFLISAPPFYPTILGLGALKRDKYGKPKLVPDIW